MATLTEMYALVDELFEAEDEAELRALGNGFWDIARRGVGNHDTILVIGRIRAAIDCLDHVRYVRSKGLYISLYNGKTSDYRSDRSRKIQDRLHDDWENDEDQSHHALVKKQIGAVKGRLQNLA